MLSLVMLALLSPCCLAADPPALSPPPLTAIRRTPLDPAPGGVRYIIDGQALTAEEFARIRHRTFIFESLKRDARGRVIEIRARLER